MATIRSRKTTLPIQLFILIYCSLLNNSYSLIAPDYVINNYEFLTPSLPADSYAKPDKFSKTNNLTQKPGSPFLAKGFIIRIEGYALDLLGSPIDNLIVRIWQANTFGYYNYLILDRSDYSKYDEDFDSTGTFITDNTGYFYFITIIPGSYGNRAPHVHLSTWHERFPDLETEIILENHPKNAKDPKWKALNQNQRKLLTCKFYKSIDTKIPTCKLQLRLNGIDKKKKY